MQVHHYESDPGDIKVGDVVDDEGCICILVYIEKVDVDHDDTSCPYLLVEQEAVMNLKNYRPYITIDLETGRPINKYNTLEEVNESCGLLRQNHYVKITI